MSKLSLPKDKIRILLLEGIHPSAVAALNADGYSNVETLPHALAGEELKARIANVHMIGLRSNTKLTADVLSAAKRLMSIGCFCIGTNQVDLNAAKRMGVPVFNAPYSNTRSVAELVLGQIIMLLRGIPEKNANCHIGVWRKSAKDSHEVRGKVLGIIGYGHIGSQLSVMAEGIGMKVRYFDIEKKLTIGNAQSCASLDELLAVSDVVSLHVPATPQTRDMITARELGQMKPGSWLVNAARGNVVVIGDLVAALKSRHLLGAAIDVFPVEPASNNDEFVSPLREFQNVILTPHIGGSTEEAQESIGTEVVDKLIKYSDNGSTVGAVNFVEVFLPVKAGGTRFLHIHENVPGVLIQVNNIFSGRGLNISAQYLQTDGETGYVVIDADGDMDERAVLEDLQKVKGTVRARILY
ncbi:MAG: phosphoglycerate dehydrogenase [Rhodospirillales bacterium]|nr:phosphoglycerate dehydrogenase [Rhodospirillales bacterium]